MGQKVGQVGEIEEEFRYAGRRRMETEHVLQPVGLGGDVVGHHDRRGFLVEKGSPPAVFLVPASPVDHRLDRSIRPPERNGFRIDAEPVLEQGVGAGREEGTELDLIPRISLHRALVEIADNCINHEYEA